MNNLKFTGANIAAALLLIFYFFTWQTWGVNAMSGFSMTTTGISPGINGSMMNGTVRLYYVLLLLVPLASIVILNQNITGNMKFSKFYKPAQIVPFLLLLAMFYFLHQALDYGHSVANDRYHVYNRFQIQNLEAQAPGMFDILNIGFYLALISSGYLFLLAIGKVRDKEYYKLKNSANETTEVK